MIANGRSPGQRRRKLILDVKIGPTSTDHWTLAGLCSLMSRLTLTDSYIAFRLFITLSVCVCSGMCFSVRDHIFGTTRPFFANFLCFYLWGWLGSRVVRVLDSGAEGPGFKSQSRRCRVTVLGKLFTPNVPLFTKQQNW